MASGTIVVARWSGNGGVIDENGPNGEASLHSLLLPVSGMEAANGFGKGTAVAAADDDDGSERLAPAEVLQAEVVNAARSIPVLLTGGDGS